MTLEVLDSLSGGGLASGLTAQDIQEARALVAIGKRLNPGARRVLDKELATVGAPPAGLDGLDGWFANVKKKAGKALKKVAASKILAAATGGIPFVGPLLAPLAAKAAEAAGKKQKGDTAGAAKATAELQAAVDAAATGAQSVTPVPGVMAAGLPKWALPVGAAAVLALVMLKGARR